MLTSTMLNCFGTTKWMARKVVLMWPYLLVASAFPAVAHPIENRFDRTIPASVNPRIYVQNLGGQVAIQGWELSQVHLVCTASTSLVDFQVGQLPPFGPDERFRLTVHLVGLSTPGSHHQADCIFDVPLDATVEVRNPEGAVSVTRLRGPVSVETWGGSTSVTEVSDHLAVRSLGGDITMVRTSGRVEATSVSGNLRFVDPAGLWLTAATTSGKIAYEGDFVRSGEYRLSTYNGDIEVLCPITASFELRAKSIRGRVIADPSILAGLNHRSTSSRYGLNSLSLMQNAGRATVHLTSYSGTARIVARE